jgi:site-specific recombinase XerD
MADVVWIPSLFFPSFLLSFFPFFRFLQHHEPAAVGQVRRVLAIPFKKTDHRLVPYLAQEEMQALLDAPDPSTRM